MVFIPEQRAVLIAAWERGFLCDTQNYRPLSRITGLTRKQISNWRRNQIIKRGERPLPKRSTTPLCSSIHELAAALKVKDPSFLSEGHVKSTSQKSEDPYILLSVAWKKGYLLDCEHYGALSKITGLNRKQISGFARKRLRSNKWKPLPIKGPIPCSPSFRFFCDIMAYHKSRRMVLAPIVQISGDPGQISGDPLQPTRKRKRGFTDQQRRILIVSWQRGYLCDKTHYQFLSQITGLTRKQISNWATMRMHKQGNNILPIRSSAFDSAMMKDFRDILWKQGKTEEVAPTSMKRETELFPRPNPVASICGRVKLEKDKPGFAVSRITSDNPFIQHGNFSTSSAVFPPEVYIKQEAVPGVKLEPDFQDFRLIR